jgi:hypothetical protein
MYSRIFFEDGVAGTRIIYEDVDGGVERRLRLPCFVPREGVGRWVFREGRGDLVEFLQALAWLLGLMIYRFEEFSHLCWGVGIPCA